MESVRLTTSDGVALDGDLLDPPDGTVRVGGVVVCHPHPQYGGDRFDTVVDAVFRHLPTLGFTALRFDFRAAFGGGTAERLDVVAALDTLADRGVEPLHLAGYSFGAAVALATDDDRIVRAVAIAPPLSMMDVPTPPRPVLVLVPQHDQFTPPDVARPIVDGWPDAEMRVIDGVDHFLLGRAAAVADAAGDWLCVPR